MATNPDNAVGTNAAYGGRTSVNAFNDDLAAYSRGIMSGWACSPNSGLTVSLGGSGNVRDVAVAEDNAGNRTTIDNISGSPVDVTMSAAPGANSRIDAIVAYVDNPPQGSSTIADNYEACGLIVVDGTAAANPTAPSDNAIRSAITADGASGTTAYYVVLALITIASGTTDITGDMIAEAPYAVISPNQIDFTNMPSVSTSASIGNIASTATMVNYTRVGNQVSAYIQQVLPSMSAHGSGATMASGAIPDGFKPVDTAMLIGGAVDGGSTTGNMSIILRNNNTNTLYNGFTSSGNVRVVLSGSWSTTDPWPTV